MTQGKSRSDIPHSLIHLATLDDVVRHSLPPQQMDRIKWTFNQLLWVPLTKATSTHVGWKNSIPCAGGLVQGRQWNATFVNNVEFFLWLEWGQ